MIFTVRHLWACEHRVVAGQAVASSLPDRPFVCSIQHSIAGTNARGTRHVLASRAKHINFRDLFRLKDQLGLRPCNIRLQCETCLLAKCHKQPFPISKTISIAPLDLIHSDVSGIVRQPSHSLYKYFLTFIDNYSRYTHLFLLKSKTEVLVRFVDFKTTVELQLDTKI